MSLEKAERYLEHKGMLDRVIRLKESTATVAEAAEALGVEPGMIAKTMSFLQDGQAVLILTEGTARIDNRKYKDAFHMKAKMIPFEEVEQWIGHVPGGVCPFGIRDGVEVYLDESLRQFETVYPAAGDDHSAVRLSVDELEQIAGVKMNEIMESLYQRKSMRAYEDREIPEEMKKLILKAASQAPTAGCQQLYTILDITDQKLKEALSESCDHQPFIAKAPMVLVFCADCKKWYDAYLEAGCEPRKPGVGDLMLAVTDTVIAAQNAVVAAESFGLGSCYIGDIMENCEEQRRLLCLPDYVFPAAMLVLGWPTEQQKQRPKPERCEQKHIVHENTYRDMDGEELREMFAYKCKNRTYEEWCNAFCNRKYNSDFSKEMSRSVEKYLEQFGL